MFKLSITLMLIGVGGIVAGVLTHIVKELWEEWKAGFKTDVLFVLAFLIPMIFLAVGIILFVIYK